MNPMRADCGGVTPSSRDSERLAGRWTVAVLVGVVLAGALLRFSDLGAQSFWFNEAASYHYAKGSAADVIRRSFTIETNPPGFHLLVHAWSRVAGVGEAALRFPSALAGTLTLLVMVAFARCFLGRAAALAAAAMLALAPQHLWYSQECRAFACWTLFILCAWVALLRWRRDERPRFLILNAAFVWLAVSFHYFGFHVFWIQNVWLLLDARGLLRRRWRQWVAVQCALGAALAPFAWMMVAVDRSHVAWWQESGFDPGVLKSLAFHLNGVFFMLTPQRVFKAAILAANAILFVLGLIGLARDRRLTLPALALFGPIAANAAYSVLVSPILGNAQSAGRYFLLTLPPFILILARGWQVVFRRTPGRPVAGALLFLGYLALCATGVFAMHRNQAFARDDNRALCRTLFAEAQEGDVLIASPFITVDYYATRFGFDLDRLTVIRTSRFEPPPLDQVPPDRQRLWLFLDPAHHFDSLVETARNELQMEIVFEQEACGLSGVALVLLERPSAPQGSHQP